MLTKDKNMVEMQLSLLVYKQGDYFVAYCPSLELSSYGDSVEDAKTGFDDAMNIYLEHCLKNGTLVADLVKHGWNVEKNPTKLEPPLQIKLNIPTGNLISQLNLNRYMPIN
jgi:predicted RNase H-like HicB family nuclease